MAALRLPPPCQFFAAGTCTRGTRCKFSHDNARAAAAQVECRYFKLGTCANGHQCRFLHVRSGGTGVGSGGPLMLQGTTSEGQLVENI